MSGTSSAIPIGGSEDVEYDSSYTIQSIIRKLNENENEHILFPSTPFKTPLGPTLSFVSCVFHSSNPNILNLTLTSARMPSEDFTLTLKTTELPVETVHLVVSSAVVSTGFILVEVYKKTNTLKYGREYSIAGMKSSSVTAVVLASPFRTPSEPIRITSAECSLGGEQQKSAVVTLTGVKLGGGNAFNVTVQKMVESTLIGDGIVLSGILAIDSSSPTHTG
ncbi:hypothetical protein BLNAU_19963 [Blattamonas nauphoetae]|uniref:Uncharacterized protein n=1 Tax=Blattamonas nauphoetae TaxID=2049346 RepID=A0ABQ9X186_9EUKA|nr:hypothetical protein BLNAU_19963 [Blattamonas nauphoetae]